MYLGSASLLCPAEAVQLSSAFQNWDPFRPLSCWIVEVQYSFIFILYLFLFISLFLSPFSPLPLSSLSPNSCWVSTRENYSDTGLSQQKVFISQLPATWDVWDASTVTSLPQDELLSTKNKFWIDTLQLKRRGTEKWQYRSWSVSIFWARIVHFWDIPKISFLVSVISVEPSEM